jgi:putative hydrolase of the HAD superfamily
MTEKTHPKLLMLDVDGVLVDGRPQDGKHLFTDLETDLGISLDSLQQAFFTPYFQAIVTGKDALQPRLAAVLKKIAPGVSADSLIAYWFENDSRIVTPVLDAVGTLRQAGARVFLATNQEHLRARYLMEDMGLGHHVDGIAYSAALGWRKPKPEFYRLAAELAGAEPADIVLVDDIEANVLAARAAGWRAVHWHAGMELLPALSAA